MSIGRDRASTFCHCFGSKRKVNITFTRSSFPVHPSPQIQYLLSFMESLKLQHTCEYLLSLRISLFNSFSLNYKWRIITHRFYLGGCSVQQLKSTGISILVQSSVQDNWNYKIIFVESEVFLVCNFWKYYSTNQILPLKNFYFIARCYITILAT